MKIFLAIAAFAINDFGDIAIEPLVTYAEVREVNDFDFCCEDCFKNMCEDCLDKLFPEEELVFCDEESSNEETTSK
jgi:hypothetical protein